MKEKQGVFRWAVSLALCSAACLGIFFLRKGWERPFLGVADSFCVSGFFTLAFPLLSYLTKGEAFDGFAYAARSAVAGIFPRIAESYASFKEKRNARREEKCVGAFTQSVAGEAWVGGSFLAVGLFFCLFA